MALFHLLSMNHLRYLLKKSGLWKCLLSHFGVLVLNHSSNNTVFCLHGFVSLKKPRKWRTACTFTYKLKVIGVMEQFVKVWWCGRRQIGVQTIKHAHEPFPTIHCLFGFFWRLFLNTQNDQMKFSNSGTHYP